MRALEIRGAVPATGASLQRLREGIRESEVSLRGLRFKLSQFCRLSSRVWRFSPKTSTYHPRAFTVIPEQQQGPANHMSWAYEPPKKMPVTCCTWRVRQLRKKVDNGDEEGYSMACRGYKYTYSVPQRPSK